MGFALVIGLQQDFIMIRTHDLLILTLLLSISVILPASPAQAQSSPSKNPTLPPEIQALYRSLERDWKLGRSASIGRLLAPKVDLNLPGYRGRYGRVQATKIIDTFFSRIKTQQFKILQPQANYARAVHEYIENRSRVKRTVFIRLVRLDRRWLIDKIETF